jgi:hypothetical protein
MIYDDLEIIIQKVFKSLSNSEKIVRLLAIDSSDALTKTLTTTFNDLQFKRWFPLPKNINPATEAGTYLMVYYTYGNMAGSNNVYQHDANFELFFACHESVWAMDKSGDSYRIRPYQMMSECRKVLEEIELEEAFRGKLLVYPPTMVTPTDSFLGYKIAFKITGNSK